MSAASDALAAKICLIAKEATKCALSDLGNQPDFVSSVTNIANEVVDTALTDVTDALENCKCECFVWLNDSGAIAAVTANNIGDFEASFNGGQISGSGFADLHNQALAMAIPVNITIVAGQLHATAEGDMKATVGQAVIKGPFKPCE